MKVRPWPIVVLILILCTIPLGVTAEDTTSWDTYQTDWTEYEYKNVTTMWLSHPINGSLVSDNQKLRFIIVPFDADQLGYTVDVYKNDILVYTCNQERVYDFYIYTTNAIDQKVIVTVYVDNVLILRLVYLAVLSAPSFNVDYTDEWLAYQAEKEKGTTGQQIIDVRDKSLSDMSLVATTGIICIILSVVAYLIVMVFQIVSPMNFFSAVVVIISFVLFVRGMSDLQTNLASIQNVTPDDVMVYHTKVIILLMYLGFALLFFFFVYIATGKRLDKIKFSIINIKDRTETRLRAVIGHKDGKNYWRWQDSVSASRRVFKKEDYEIDYEGDITDRYKPIELKVDSSKFQKGRHFRAIRKHLNAIASSYIFHLKPNPDKVYKKKKTKDNDQRHDYNIWKDIDDKTSEPIIYLDAPPEKKVILDTQKEKTIEEKMKALQEATDPTIIDELKKELKQLKKDVDKPIGFKVFLPVSNRTIYGVEHFVTDRNVYQKQAELIKKQNTDLHKKEATMDVKIILGSDEIHKSWDEVINKYKPKDVRQ